MTPRSPNHIAALLSEKLRTEQLKKRFRVALLILGLTCGAAAFSFAVANLLMRFVE